jgi:hypothetical protein
MGGKEAVRSRLIVARPSSRSGATGATIVDERVRVNNRGARGAVA